MLPAGEIDKTVVDTDAVVHDRVGVFHIARRDLSVERPVLRLGFDVNGRILHHHVNDAAVILVLVAALY
ncbi:MAG: hypothetical protein J6S41_03385, partial [Clostridia bacterium]|nr:hypothetical protein [Clostridia bacterium]